MDDIKDGVITTGWRPMDKNGHIPFAGMVELHSLSRRGFRSDITIDRANNRYRRVYVPIRTSKTARQSRDGGGE